jgi:hypothetical protein
MRVAMAFSRLIARIQPGQLGVSKARLHTGAIRTRLNTSFGPTQVVYMGSTARKTAIKGHSDVDLLAVLPRKVARWGGDLVKSDTFLKNVRDDLNARFARTEVGRDGQAVVIHFGGGSEPVDVVPSIFHEFKTEKKVPVYLIPDGSGGWLETAPAAHNNFIGAEDERSGGKLNRTIQLLKHWRYSRQAPVALTSIHLELLLAASEICVGPKSYARCLYDAFDVLDSRGARGLQDPVKVAGVLKAAPTEAQRKSLEGAFRYAKEHAGAAIIAQKEGDWREALRQWDIVFNGNM